MAEAVAEKTRRGPHETEKLEGCVVMAHISSIHPHGSFFSVQVRKMIYVC